MFGINKLNKDYFKKEYEKKFNIQFDKGGLGLP